MKRVRGQQGCQKLELYPATRCCPICQEPLTERYHKRRYVVTLKQKLAVTSHVLCCVNQECAGRDQSYRPEGEGHLALPHYTFGLDVVALIGELRYRQQQTISEIAVQLHGLGIEISVKEVELLSEVFLALVQTVVEDDPLLVEELRSKGGIVLSIDGVQPEKGNETLWLLRDVRSGRVLVARNLLSSSSSELEALIEEVVKLEVPILGVISDKQESLCLAIERKLEGVPHQLCHYHYLRDMASPVCEADRGLKKRIKQKIRGIRELEVEVAHLRGEEAEVVKGYCLALRTVLREDGKYPLEASRDHALRSVAADHSFALTSSDQKKFKQAGEIEKSLGKASGVRR